MENYKLCVNQKTSGIIENVQKKITICRLCIEENNEHLPN